MKTTVKQLINNANSQAPWYFCPQKPDFQTVNKKYDIQSDIYNILKINEL